MDTDPLMKLFAAGRADGGNFDSGIEMAIERHSGLARFSVPRRESAATLSNTAAKGSIDISDLDLASRLSFFLWSSIPDEELLGLAERGKLHEPAVLAAAGAPHAGGPEIQGTGREFRRPVAAPAQRRGLEAGSGQVQGSSTKRCATPSSAKASCSSKTSSREDRSVLEFIDADYTFLNERLARYYGIQGVKGSYFRRVALTGAQGKGPERGGILTQASVLMVTSYPTRTSPVLRGKWILESILDAPPPPPPPNVPPSDETADQFRQEPAGNIRKAPRRTSPAPVAIRAWIRWASRSKISTRWAGTGPRKADSPIDASGNLPDGTLIDGVARPQENPAGPKRRIRGGLGREASDLRSRPRPGVLRSARGARYPPPGRR